MRQVRHQLDSAVWHQPVHSEAGRVPGAKPGTGHQRHLRKPPQLFQRTSHWPGNHSEPLISGAVSPYCSREFLQPHAPIDSPQALSQLPLLHDEERGTWAEWFQVAEVKHASALNGLLLEDGQLALTGLGCSLLREPLVAPMSPAANW